MIKYERITDVLLTSMAAISCCLLSLLLTTRCLSFISCLIRKGLMIPQRRPPLLFHKKRKTKSVSRVDDRTQRSRVDGRRFFDVFLFHLHLSLYHFSRRFPRPALRQDEFCLHSLHPPCLRGEYVKCMVTCSGHSSTHNSGSRPILVCVPPCIRTCLSLCDVVYMVI